MIDCRFERAPVVERKKFWHLMPVKRTHTYRRLALQHGGADGKVSECVIVRAHDRSLPLRLKMFFSGNRTQKSLGGGDNKEAAQDWEVPKAVLDIQEAVANLADVLAELWPADDTARIINRVLILYNFGAAAKGGEQDRCKLLVEFVDAVLRENASRAVVKDTPLSFRQVKERWADTAEKQSLSAAGGNQSGRSGQADSKKGGGDRRVGADRQKEERSRGQGWQDGSRGGRAMASASTLTGGGCAAGSRGWWAVRTGGGGSLPMCAIFWIRGATSFVWPSIREWETTRARVVTVSGLA